MATDLRDRVVVITGASSGIGAALAVEASARGARVGLLARRTDRLVSVASRCRGETLVLTGDVTVDRDRAAAVEQTIEAWGRIDVLVNNAGRGLYAPFLETDLSALHELLELDFVSTFAMTQSVLPSMLEAGHGAIVNVASTGGRIAHTDKVVAYLAAKHAVVGMSRGLRRELEGTGVSVQVVCPHLTATGFFDVGVGAEEMRPVAAKLRDRMDSAEDVARGIVDAVGRGPFFIFPTSSSWRAFEHFRQREEVWSNG